MASETDNAYWRVRQSRIEAEDFVSNLEETTQARFSAEEWEDHVIRRQVYMEGLAKDGWHAWMGQFNPTPKSGGDEQQVLMQAFTDMLWLATKDGGEKRSAGLKKPWWRDDEHEAAIFSHLNKWKHGELVDEHSGAHPLVHLAWRALAIAYQESYGKREPQPTEG